MNHDLLSSLFWGVVALIFAAGAFEYGITEDGVPGPGFVPLLVGLGLLATSAWLFAAVLAGKTDKDADGLSASLPLTRGSLGRILATLVALGLFIPLLARLGLLPTSFLFLALLLRAIGKSSWPNALVIAGAGAVIIYLVFVSLLNIPLPRGVFGF